MASTDRLFPKSVSEVQELERYYKKDITQIVDDLYKWTSAKQFAHLKCYIIGNGLSRKGLNLTNITRYYKNTKQKKNSFFSTFSLVCPLVEAAVALLVKGGIDLAAASDGGGGTGRAAVVSVISRNNCSEAS